MLFLFIRDESRLYSEYDKSRLYSEYDKLRLYCEKYNIKQLFKSFSYDE